MKFFRLPVKASPFYTFSQYFVPNIRTDFTIRWNRSADTYFMDILEHYGNGTDYIVKSIPITSGINLIGQYDFTMLGIWCGNVSSADEIETTRRFELGDTFHVVIGIKEEVEET